MTEQTTTPTMPAELVDAVQRYRAAVAERKACDEAFRAYYAQYPNGNVLAFEKLGLCGRDTAARAAVHEAKRDILRWALKSVPAT